MPEQHVPQSAEQITELINDVVRWVMKTSQELPEGVGGVVAVMPFQESLDEDAERYYIRIHGTPGGRIVFESPWMLIELDPSFFETNDEWWKELGL